MREDIHRPSLLDPAEYDFIAAFYQGDSPWMAQSYKDEMERYDEAVEDYDVFMGNYFMKATCDHCGASFNHGVLFLHTPSQELIHVGHICAADTVGLPDKAAAARRKAEKFHREEQAKAKRWEEGKAWREENRDLVAWLEAQPEQENDGRDFITAMKFALKQWGTLTYGQVRGIERWREGQKAREERTSEEQARKAKLENAPELVEGRRPVAGVIVSTKWKDTPYGEVFKMLVEQADGNRVWGTMPRAIQDSGDNFKGESVVFNATVTRSKDDPHFGFFAKPTQAKRV